MAFSFPVFLDLSGKAVLVAGGGPLAEEKVLALRPAGARVTLMAETVTPRLAALAAAGEIDWIRAPYREGEMAGYALVVSALDRETNARLFREAERRGILFNAVDDPKHCRFIFASTHRSGDLTVAISTNGRAPALAVRVREKLAAEIGPEYGEFLELAEKIRPAIGAQVGDFARRKALWYRLIDSPALALLRAGRRGEAEALLRNLLAEELVDFPVPAYS
jgi:siroheme synthase-like protein